MAASRSATYRATWNVFWAMGRSSFIDRYRRDCTFHRLLSISTHVDEETSSGVLRADPAEPAPGDGRRGTRRRVQGHRRSGPPAPAELHRGAALRRGVRLPSDRAGGAFAAHGESSPEGAHGRGLAGARATRHVDVLSPRAGTGGSLA